MYCSQLIMWGTELSASLQTRHGRGTVQEEIPCVWEVFPQARGTWKVFCIFCDKKKSALVRQFTKKKLGSPWVKPGKMEEKDGTIYGRKQLHMTPYHIHPERRGGFTIIKSHFHCGPLAMFLQLGILTCSWWGQGITTETAWEEEGGCEGGRSPALLSITPAVYCFYPYWPFVEFQLSLSQVRLFVHRTLQQTWTVPIDLLLLLTSVTRCLPAVPSGKCCVRHPGYFHLALGNFHFLNVFISCEPFVHSPAVRGLSWGTGRAEQASVWCSTECI